MPRSRRRKDSSFEASVTKSVFLYGRPNKDKLALLRQMQTVFTALVNEDIQILSTREDLMMQLVKNDKKDSTMRTLEKTIRRKGLSSAFSQNAFDVRSHIFPIGWMRSVWICWQKGWIHLQGQRSCLRCRSCEDPDWR